MTSTVTFVLGMFYFFGLLPAFVSERSIFFKKWSHSDRLFISSLISLCLLPVFLLLMEDPISKGLMSFGVIFNFAQLYIRADKKMHEDLVPGYKQEKERKKVYKMNFHLRKALKREQRAMLQACGKKGQL